jgi:hypothetical protein
MRHGGVGLHHASEPRIRPLQVIAIDRLTDFTKHHCSHDLKSFLDVTAWITSSGAGEVAPLSPTVIRRCDAPPLMPHPVISCGQRQLLSTLFLEAVFSNTSRLVDLARRLLNVPAHHAPLPLIPGLAGPLPEGVEVEDDKDEGSGKPSQPGLLNVYMEA